MLVYVSALKMVKCTSASRKKAWLLVALIGCFAVLFTFKYFNFVNASLHDFFAWLGQPYQILRIDLLLPIGISFYTFQAVSYAVDVYRGTQEPVHHFGIFALFKMFFP